MHCDLCKRLGIDSSTDLDDVVHCEVWYLMSGIGISVNGAIMINYRKLYKVSTMLDK